MTVAARYNLQRGVPENKMYEHTNYTSDGSALDNWLLAKMRMREMVKQYYEKKEMQAQSKEVAEELVKMIDKELDKLLKNLWVGLLTMLF